MARRPRLLARESRLGALSARLTDASVVAAELAAEEPQKRIRTFSEAAPDDLGAALDALASIRDLGLVVHGPRGCAVAPTAAKGRLAVTDLDQRDSVLGAGDALLSALRRLDRVAEPAALVVIGSPVVAINNDEIRAVIGEAAAEFAKPVVWARTDGFRSAIAATGLDAAAEAWLALIGEVEGARQGDLVNLLSSWSGPAVESLARAIETLGLRVNLLPAGATVADLRRAARAAASLVLDPDGLDAFAAGLASRFGVPRLDAPLPIGPQATCAALSSLAAATGVDAPAAPEFPGPSLAGRRIALAAPPAFGFALAGLAEAAGGEVVGLTLPHLDRSHAAAAAEFARVRPGAAIHIGDGQNFELANLWRRLAPDCVIGGVEAVATALRAGIPAARLEPAQVIGAGGLAALERAVAQALDGRNLAARLARRAPRYTPGWLRRSPDWHIKLEVR